MVRRTNHKQAPASVELDGETVAMIDAQLEGTGRERAGFIKTMLRLYLDFSFMARMAGKDVFAFRDDLIKAMVASRGAMPPNDVARPPAARDDDPGAVAVMAKELAELRRSIDELKKASSKPHSGRTHRGPAKHGDDHDDAGVLHEESDRHHNSRHHYDHDGGDGEDGSQSGGRGHGRSGAAPPLHTLVTRVAAAADPPDYRERRKKLDKIKF